jgi:hypothetical protein
MRLLHVEVLEKMADAVAAVERAADDMVEAEAGFPVFDHVPKRVRKVGWGCAKDWHGSTNPAKYSIGKCGGTAFNGEVVTPQGLFSELFRPKRRRTDI